MEWSSKVPPPPWDMAELGQGAEVSMGALAGPGFVLGSQSGGLMDCSVDLRLGGLGEFRPAERWLPNPTESSAAAAPSRRARASGNASASCLVDECKSDLSNSREYHRRHKVCEVHSKTPVVMVGGQEQRFCQQCSRFHQLVEFDEAKRSCRKRLDGHNRRRRKPPQESINTSRLFRSTQGMLGSSRFLMYPPHPTAPIPAQGHEDPPLATSFLHGDAGPFSQSTFRPMLKATPSAESGSSSSRILAQAFDSDCALSLLSAAAQEDSGIGQMLPAGRIPMHQPLVSDLAYAAAQASCYAPVGDVFVCGAGDCQCVYNAMGGGGPAEEASQAPPFSWQ
ncbi:squamosa promoter-binding-like protein 16 [Zingiber officinale]|uniref:SBP-type domain-containing protein n=1 Tax=Zingiber officinale TaxID=94328 RepID=A0A8J5L4E4_ZINOF|nr:squamosa promoter-binding-like protein 16 [Zingiber officinale]KAG6511675.1 hypothetical protein ZIOFF_029752 [Zingiber officinale]